VGNILNDVQLEFAHQEKNLSSEFRNRHDVGVKLEVICISNYLDFMFVSLFF
jgi:hypothetical protein